MEGEGVVVRGRVEIDTRQPFHSVREAILLFGEKVLAGKVYANKLKELEMQEKAKQEAPSKVGAVRAELEETKQCLEKAKEEGSMMAQRLNLVRQELEQTKRELQKLKTKETLSHLLGEPEVEEIKCTTSTPEKHMHQVEFQKKRSVKFATPLLTKIIDCGGEWEGEEGASKKKKNKNKKALVPLIGGLFFKKINNGANENGS